MITATFFPDAAFGWLYYGTLVGLLAIAAVIDGRTMKVPKLLVLMVLFGGLILSLVRGAWLGSQGLPVAYLSATGPWIGAVDAALFSLAGFATGFGLFFLLWIMGTCGGGDVKLFAALGVWLGPLWTIYILVGTWCVVMVGYVLLGYLIHVLRHGRRPRKQQVTYSFPIALSVIVILLWVFRVDLGIAEFLPQVKKTSAMRQPANGPLDQP